MRKRGFAGASAWVLGGSCQIAVGARTLTLPEAYWKSTFSVCCLATSAAMVNTRISI
jgi:hypothetical protein